MTRIFQFIFDYAYDCFHHLWQSHHSPFSNLASKLGYQIIITAHTLEKGLSLPVPRTLFGLEKIKQLCALLARYPTNADPFPVAMALGAIDGYTAFHRSAGIANPLLDDLDVCVRRISGERKVKPCGGIKSVHGVNQAVKDKTLTYSDFIASRYSSRWFQAVVIPGELINKIVEVALRCPSQCNRQGTRLHFYNEPTRIQSLLELQGGGKGFSQYVTSLFLVTYDAIAWGGSGQRNQGYIDASLLAMSLIYACHAEGIASCPLNLAVSIRRELLIKQMGKVPSNERVVMMIAVGFPDNNAGVAAMSMRRTVEKVLVLH